MPSKYRIPQIYKHSNDKGWHVSSIPPKSPQQRTFKVVKRGGEEKEEENEGEEEEDELSVSSSTTWELSSEYRDADIREGDATQLLLPPPPSASPPPSLLPALSGSRNEPPLLLEEDEGEDHGLFINQGSIKVDNLEDVMTIDGNVSTSPSSLFCLGRLNEGNLPVAVKIVNKVWRSRCEGLKKEYSILRSIHRLFKSSPTTSTTRPIFQKTCSCSSLDDNKENLIQHGYPMPSETYLKNTCPNLLPKTCDSVYEAAPDHQTSKNPDIDSLLVNPSLSPLSINPRPSLDPPPCPNLLNSLSVHVVRPIALYETPKEVALVTEQLDGPDLCQLLIDHDGGRLTESEARVVLCSVLKTLQIIHHFGYIHRDVKLPNLVLRRAGDPSSVTLVDFGCSGDIREGLEMFRICGSPGSCAPEVLIGSGAYDEKIDVFSAGVVLYTLLSGEAPFTASTPLNILRLNCRGSLSFDSDIWNNSDFLSPEAKDLTIKMTERCPDKRLSVEDSLLHEWFKC